MTLSHILHDLGDLIQVAYLSFVHMPGAYKLGLLLSILAAAGYYLFAWRDHLFKRQSPVTLPNPADLSPTLLHYLYRGETDWNLLITNFFQAVSTGLYSLDVNPGKLGVYLRLQDRSIWDELTHLEQKGLGFGQPLPTIFIGKVQTRMMTSLIEQMEAELAVQTRPFILRKSRHVFIAIGIQWAGFILTNSIWGLYPVMSIYYGIMMALTALMVIIGTDYLQQHLKGWYSGILYVSYLVACTAIMAILTMSMMAKIFGICLLIHAYLLIKASPYTARGLHMLRSIEAYRESWLKKEFSEDRDVPYLQALQIPHDFDHYIESLFSEEPNMKGKVGWEYGASFYRYR